MTAYAVERATYTRAYAGDDPANEADPSGEQCGPSTSQFYTADFYASDESVDDFTGVAELEFNNGELDLKLGFEDLPFNVDTVAYSVDWSVNGHFCSVNRPSTPFHCIATQGTFCNDHDWTTEVTLAEDDSAEFHHVKLKAGAFLGLGFFTAAAVGLSDFRLYVASEQTSEPFPIAAINANVSAEAQTSLSTTPKHH
jgi:hypothetical protein